MQNLLDSIYKSIEKHKEIESIKGDSFNLFIAGGNIGMYENMHNNIIAELLDKNGSHMQKDKFLKLFLKILNEKYEDYEVYREYSIDNGRVDIVLSSPNKIIGIEVKLRSKDRKNQLVKYDEFLQKQSKDCDLYYLTLGGKEAENEENKNRAITISFKEHIIKWLDLCIKEVVNMPYLREALIHYKKFFEKLTDQNDLLKDEVMELISKSPRNMEAAHHIFNNYEEAWARKEKEFFEEVWNKTYEKLEKANMQEWLNDGDSFYYNIWYDEKGDELDDETIIKNILSKFNSNYFTIGVNFYKKIDNSKIVVGLEYNNNERLYFYYQEFDQNNKSVLNKIKELSNMEKADDFLWKNCSKEINLYKNNNLTFELFDSNFLKKIKNDVSKEFFELIKQVDNILKEKNVL